MQNQIFQGKVPVTDLILHCAAIKTSQFNGLTAYEVRTEINRWHEQRGFTGFGYHGLIMPNGEYLRGRPFFKIGAHCRENGKNRGSLGFLLIESVQITKIGVFSDWFTPQQMATLRAQIQGLRALGITRISGHNDHANRLCPGFRVSDYFRN